MNHAIRKRYADQSRSAHSRSLFSQLFIRFLEPITGIGKSWYFSLNQNIKTKNRDCSFEHTKHMLKLIKKYNFALKLLGHMLLCTAEECGLPARRRIDVAMLRRCFKVVCLLGWHVKQHKQINILSCWALLNCASESPASLWSCTGCGSIVGQL